MDTAPAPASFWRITYDATVHICDTGTLMPAAAPSCLQPTRAGVRRAMVTSTHAERRMEGEPDARSSHSPIHAVTARLKTSTA